MAHDNYVQAKLHNVLVYCKLKDILVDDNKDQWWPLPLGLVFMNVDGFRYKIWHNFTIWVYNMIA